MILWTFKLINTARRAIAGRKHPHQLAWGVAFGLLLGIVPHGNLLAVALLVLVVSLKLNHAMAALTAVGASFLASPLDPYSHQLGNLVLSHPRLNEYAVSAWSQPLVPWTDLNNTIVMGSFLLGVGALVPTFMVTYPLFRLIAPSTAEEPSTAEDQDDAAKPQTPRSVDRRTATSNPPQSTAASTAGKLSESTHQVVLVDRQHGRIAAPHKGQSNTGSSAPAALAASDFVEVAGPPRTSDDQVAVETRIDVIRVQDKPAADSDNHEEPEANQPMDEALNYLLRQLRDSQQRSAA